MTIFLEQQGEIFVLFLFYFIKKLSDNKMINKNVMFVESTYKPLSFYFLVNTHNCMTSLNNIN